MKERRNVGIKSKEDVNRKGKGMAAEEARRKGEENDGGKRVAGKDGRAALKNEDRSRYV